MKKLVAISILLTLLTAAAFAQLGFKVTGEFYPDLLLITAPTGDATEPDTQKAIANQGLYGGVGTVNFLTINEANALSGEGNALNVAISYKEPEQARYGGLLTLSVGRLFTRAFVGDNSFFGQADVSNRTVTFTDILASGIGDWNLWGKVGMLTGFVGNAGIDENGAAVPAYNDAFNTILTGGTKIDDLGITVPGINVQNLGTDLSIFGSAVAVDSIKSYPYSGTLNDKPYFSVSADLGQFVPIKVDLAGDMSQVTDPTGNAIDPEGNPEGYGKVGVAARVSGKKIADLVSFDAIYKLYGGDFDTEDKRLETPADPTQPHGDGYYGHNFGIFGNISILNDTLGITAGYSGLTATQEKTSTTNGDITYIHPYYNGIDLRFNFTGVDKLILSFNNNVSFATTTGDDDELTERVSVVGLYGGTGKNGAPWALANSKQSEGYLSLYNALGLKYQFTDALYFNFQIANRLASYTMTQEVNTTDNVAPEEFIFTVMADNFRAGLGAGYAFGDHVLFETGLVFDLKSASINGTVGNNWQGNDNLDFGQFTFAIPIHFKVQLP